MQTFERNLEDNLFALHKRLSNKSYKHGGYSEFYVNDPKRRHIHKASVTDRIVHHLLYKYLYGIFDKTFIYDSYSCRLNKGTHRAVKRLEKFARKISKNYTKNFWALKLDIKQFFASVNHDILLKLIAGKVEDENILWLIKEIIASFSTGHDMRGIPLGNLTSQILANIYLNELDKFMKQKLKVKYYLRYADDFLLLSVNKQYLLHCFETVKYILKNPLMLELHPKKIILRKFSWGIDYCGYVVLPHYVLPRPKTKKRIFARVEKGSFSNQSIQSYIGYLSHAQSYVVQQQIKNLFYLNLR